MKPGPTAHQLLQVVHQHGLAHRPWGQQILALSASGLLSETIAWAFLAQADEQIRDQEMRPNRLMRAPEYEELYPDEDPDIVIGRLVESDVPLGLSLKGNCNAIHVGRSGSGKTTGVRNTILQTYERNKRHPDQAVSLICNDRKGGDFADFLALGDDWLHQHFLSTLRIGLNPPDGFDDDVWINFVSGDFCARAGLVASSVGFAKLLRFLVYALNQGRSDSPKLYPDPRLMHQVATSVPPTLFFAKEAYYQACCGMLEGATQASGPMFETFGGLDLDRDICRRGKNLVLDVCGLSPGWVRAFANDLLLRRLLLGRQWRYDRRDRVDCHLFLDEADQDVSQKWESQFADMSPISLVLKQDRESGIAVTLSISALSPAARMILTNASHLFCYAMSDAASLAEAANAALLPPGAEAILPAMRPGECLYRGPGPWPHAMLAQTHDIPPSRVPRPDEYDSIPYIPSKPLEELPHVQEAVRSLIAQHRAKRLVVARQSKPQSSAKARKLLDLLTIDLCAPCARLWEQMGTPSPAVQKAVRTELEDQDLILSEDCRVGSTTMWWADVAPAGYEFLNKPPPKATGRGGAAHRRFARVVAQVHKLRGHSAVIEPIVAGNHPGDVGWQIDDAWHVVEIVVHSPDNLLGHIKVCLVESNAVASVTVVAPLKSMLDDLRRIVEADPQIRNVLDRINYEPIESYLNILWP